MNAERTLFWVTSCLRRIGKTVALTALWCLAAQAARGALSTFDFAYTFASGNVVSGTLQGDLAGNFVENVQDVTVSVNGNPIVGHIFAAHLDNSGSWLEGAVVSFVGTQNNFIFATSDWGNGDYAAGANGTEFVMRLPFGFNPGYSYVVGVSSVPLSNLLDVEGNLVGSPVDNVSPRWSLNEVTPVPEAATTAAGLLSLGIAALAFRRRRF